MNFKELVEKELDPQQIVKALSGDKQSKEEILSKLVTDKDDVEVENKQPEKKKKPVNQNKNNDPISGNKNKTNIAPSHEISGSIKNASWLKK